MDKDGELGLDMHSLAEQSKKYVESQKSHKFGRIFQTWFIGFLVCLNIATVGLITYSYTHNQNANLESEMDQLMLEMVELKMNRRAIEENKGKHKLLIYRESAAGSVIQATGTLEF